MLLFIMTRLILASDDKIVIAICIGRFSHAYIGIFVKSVRKSESKLILHNKKKKLHWQKGDLTFP